MSDTKNLTPKELAAELGMPDAKRLRAYLRTAFARSPEAKNTSWAITPEAVEAAREHFKKQETPSVEA